MEEKELHERMLQLEEQLEDATIHVRRTMGRLIAIKNMIEDMLPERPPPDPDDLP